MIRGDPIRISAPAALPVSLAELKAHARIDGATEDVYLAALIRVATEYAEQYTGLALITSIWTQTFSAFTETNPERNVPLVLRRRPLQEVLSVEYMTEAASGSPYSVPRSVLEPNTYRTLRIGSDITPSSIELAYGAAWPTAYTDNEAILVTYRAGFGDDYNTIPELIRHAILMAASTWYGFREDVIMGSTVAELPFASKTLLNQWRPLAVA